MQASDNLSITYCAVMYQQNDLTMLLSGCVFIVCFIICKSVYL